MLPFPIKLTDGLPASAQIVLAVRKAILAGLLRDGDEFPSVRVLSQGLKVAPATVHKALLQLRDEGLLATRPGVGMVVRSADAPATPARLEMLAPALLHLVREAQALQLSPKVVADAVRQAMQQAQRDDDQT